MADRNVRFTFEITTADGALRTLELSQEMVKIGKHPSSHILIDEAGVSRMHAYIEASPAGEVVVMDLGSASGTFVNGEKVTKKRALVSGDRLRVGDANIQVWLDGATGASAATSPVASLPTRQAKPVPAAKPVVASAPQANPFAPLASPAAAKPARAANPFAARPEAAMADPFAAPRSATPAAAFSHDESDGDAYYAMVAAAPPVAASEIESNVPAIEVMVMWGERDILHVSHLSPPRAFVVGEGAGDAAKGEVAPDFRMEAEFLGSDKLVFAAPEGNGVVVIVPSGATITVRNDADLRADAALRNGGELHASTLVPGALQYRLREGETARVAFKGFVFQVKAVQAGLVLGHTLRPDAAPFYYVGGVGAFFLSLFLVVSFLLPPASMLGGDQLDLDNRYIQAAIEAQQQPEPEHAASAERERGGSGQAAAGETGEAGERDREHTNHRMAVQGSAAQEDRVLGQTSSADQAEHNVVTNAVASIAAMFSSGPTSAYGAEQAIGGDPMSAIGNLLGAQIGASGGVGGLGLVGSGVGSGGTGHGTYGMGNQLGTLGQAGGTGDGDRYGRDGGGLGDRQAAHVRVPTIGQSAVNGGLTADQIRRVIQRNVAQVQHCYEQGLQRNPSLAGRVTVSFMIMPTGQVGSAGVADNSVGDSAVGSCVAGAVRRWAFPQPDPAGPVSVRFPFNLSQSGN